MIVVDGHAGESRTGAIARRLRGEFAQLNLSGSEVARRTGITQARMSRRLTGRVPFDVDELDLICSTIGISFNYITTGIREMPYPEPPHPAQTPSRSGQLLRLHSTARRSTDDHRELVEADDDAARYVALAEGTLPTSKTTGLIIPLFPPAQTMQLAAAG